MSFFVCIVEYNSMNLNYFKFLSLLLIQLYISNIYAESNPINYFPHNISVIDKTKPFVFWRFLEMYTDAEQRSDQVKIMTDYYVGCSEERYRLPALMFMYNAFDPLNPAERKRMIYFLKQHMFDTHVLGLFLYRYGSYKHDPPLSFIQLYKVLIDRISNFSFPDIESLHFIDLMISQEITKNNFIEIRDLLSNMWKNEILNQSLIYQANRHWFKKVHSYTSLGLRHQSPRIVNHKGFVSSRRKFFKKFGYSANNIIKNLELTFRLNDAAFRLPEFLPRFILNSESKEEDKIISINSPFIFSESAEK